MMRFFEKVLEAIGKIIAPFFLLALRLLFGYAFFEAGLGKLNDIEKTSAFFNSLGILYPTYAAYAVGFVEMAGGAMLAMGFLSRFTALSLSIVMITAYITAHYGAIENFLISPSGIAKEAPFNFLVTSLTVLCFGPGLFSLDSILGLFREKKKAKPIAYEEE